ncbi:MAG: hypothetical protein RLY16_125 [Bacteroidota bacterium]
MLSAWIAVGVGTLVLLVAAMKREEKQLCKGLNISIRGVNNHFFVDKNDILKAINDYMDGGPEGHPVSMFNLRALESELEKNIWVKQIQMFFDQNVILQVNVLEREPVARIFTASGNTFYVDSSLKVLPLSEKFSARLPVFTNFPTDKLVLTKTDSLLLRDICNVSMAIQQDPFRMAMIEQVDINAQRQFDMIPKVGDMVISFGNGQDIEEKFKKLQLFYKKIVTKSGWNYYSVVNLQYKNQVVAKRRDAADITADSSGIAAIIQRMAALAEQQANDSLQTMAADNLNNSTNVNLIMESLERNDMNENTEGGVESNPVTIPAIGIPVKPPVQAQPATALPPKPSTATPVKLVPNPMKPDPKPASSNVTGNKPNAVASPKPVAVVPAAKPKPAKPAEKPTEKPAKKPAAKPDNDY